MRLAVPIWEGRISPVFDVARHLLLVEAENGLERSREERAVGEHSPYSWVPMLAELGVDSLICGAITEALSAALTGHGIRVIPWIRGEVEEFCEEIMMVLVGVCWGGGSFFFFF